MIKTILFVLILLCSSASFAQNVHVDGYFKKDGTYVAPHWRSAPDGDKSNNWSSKGNYNPFTGKEGYKSYDDNDRYNFYGNFYDD